MGVKAEKKAQRQWTALRRIRISVEGKKEVGAGPLKG